MQLSFLTTLLVVLTCARAGAQCELQKLTASSAGDFDFFGSALALDGDTAVAGAPGHSSAGTFTSGAAFVFRRADLGFVEEAELLAAGNTSFAHFGAAVDIDGDTIVVGAPDGDAAGPDSGAAYVFVRSGATWIQEVELIPGGLDAADRFGRSVAVDGDTIAVGSPYTGTGTVFVFVRSGGVWREQAALCAAVALDANMGESVALAGDVLVAGAPREDVAAHDAGAACVFRRSGSGWAREATLLASNAEFGARFGQTAALDVATAVVGAILHGGSTLAGSAYVFEHDGAGWDEVAVLQPSDPDTDMRVGSA